MTCLEIYLNKMGFCQKNLLHTNLKKPNIRNQNGNDEGNNGKRLDGFSSVESDVDKAMLMLKNKCSTDHDGISASLMKEAPKFFAEILAPIFNKSLRSGIFPSMLKLA